MITLGKEKLQHVAFYLRRKKQTKKKIINQVSMFLPILPCHIVSAHPHHVVYENGIRLEDLQ